MPDPTVASIAGTKALQSLISSLYASATGKLKDKLKSWKNNARAQTLYSNISQVRNVKTIWQVEKEVDLLEFYYPTRILHDQKNIEAKTISDFGYSGHILIRGIVGQGKSMFLRFLCSQELQIGARIPVFVELRQISPGLGVRELIVEQLLTLGLDVGLSDFNSLAKTGKVVLFLDAFDEVPQSEQQQLVADLQKLADRFDELQIVVTTRPDSAIVHSANFRVFQIASIVKDDFAPIINKLTNASEVGRRLIKALKSNPRDIHGILTTPLMVTLLVIKYCADEIVPDRLSDFYEDLFELLFHRHDKTKPGYVRETKTGLNDRRIRRVFNAFCFLLRQDTTTNVTRREALEYSKKSIELSAEVCDEADFLSDMVDVTNLVLRESNRYFFLHKSVQEFHSAAYLREIDDSDTIRQFYEGLIEANWMEWREELAFLAEIDPYRFAKFFRIADCEKFFARVTLRVPKSWNRTPTSNVYRVLDAVEVCIVMGDDPEWIGQTKINNKELGWTFGNAVKLEERLIPDFDRFSSVARARTIKPVSAKLDLPKHLSVFSENGSTFVLRGRQIVDLRVLDRSYCTELIHSSIASVVEEYHAALALIEIEGARKSILLTNTSRSK